MIALYFILATSLIAFGLLSLSRQPITAPGRLIALVVLFYGLVVKPLFVVFSIPSDEFIDHFLLSPLSRSEYWDGSVALMACYGLFVFAMVFTSHLLDRFRTPRAVSAPTHFTPGRAGVLLAVGLLGSASFVWENSTLLAGASKNVLASEDLASYSGSGSLRLVTSILYVLPFLMMLNIGGGYRVRASYVLLWLSSIAWVAFGFVSDQRGLILFSVLSWFIAFNMLVGKVNRKHLLLGMGIAFGMVLLKTVNRLISEEAGAVDLFNEIIGNYIGRNLVENGKTLIIIKSIPDVLPYALGTSYVDSILILIPRSLVQSKLTVNLDTIIGNAVFGCEYFGACAVPPGLIAESYLNFGPLWMIVSAVVCGWLTAWLDWKSARGGPLFRAFYASLLVYFSISVLGSGVASFITLSIMHAMVLWPSYLATKRNRPRMLEHGDTRAFYTGQP